MKLNSLSEIYAYFQGRIDGITNFAWWKDGLQYVGTTGRTLAEEKASLYARRDRAIEVFNEGKEVFAD